MIEYSPQERKDAAEKLWLESGTYDECKDEENLEQWKHGWIGIAMRIPSPGNHLARMNVLQCALTRTQAELAEAVKLLKVYRFEHRRHADYPCKENCHMDTRCNNCDATDAFLARHAQEKVNANTD